jgi:hypothetical protein
MRTVNLIWKNLSSIILIRTNRKKFTSSNKGSLKMRKRGLERNSKY